MLRKQITYTDYNGRQRTENFYFALSQAELLEMELGTVGGMRNLIRLMIDKQNIPEIIKALKKFIMDSYGEKSLDGVRFIKSPELSLAFSQTDAYNKLFMELMSDGSAAAAFINSVIPEEVAQRMAAADEESSNESVAEIPQTTTPVNNVVAIPAANQDAPKEDGEAHMLTH